MTLIDLVKQHKHRLVMPLMGFPGIQLTETNIKQNLFDGELHFKTIQSLANRFQPDVVFSMMDMTVEASALGLQVEHPLNEAPSVISHPVHKVSDLAQFKDIDFLADKKLQAFLDTIRFMSKRLDTFSGAYVIGPISLAGLMIGMTNLALATVDQPELVKQTVELSTRLIQTYAHELVNAGADMICVLEPTAVLLSPRAYRKYCSQPIQTLFASLDCPSILHVCGDSKHLLKELSQSGAQGLSLDSLVDFRTAIQTIPEDVVYIGNIDPVRIMINGTPETVSEATQKLLLEIQPYQNAILSTGCDLPPETPLENINALMQTARSFEQ